MAKTKTPTKSNKNERTTHVVSIRIPKDVYQTFRNGTDKTFQEVLYQTVIDRIFEVLHNDKP